MQLITKQFWVSGLVMMLFGITMVVVGTINNFLVVEFGVDKLFIGLCASILAAGVFSGLFSFGPMVEQWGYKPVMLGGLLLAIAGITGIVYSPMVIYVPVFFFFIGAGGGTVNGATNMLVAKIFPENNSAYLSLLGVFYGVGALGLPLLTSLMLENDFPYQTILKMAAGFLFIPTLLVLFLKFPGAGKSEPIPLKKFFLMFTHPAILFFGFYMFFQGSIEGIIPVWAPSYLSEITGVTYEKGLYAITISASGLTFARLLLGRFLKIYPSFRVLLVSMVIFTSGTIIFGWGSSFLISLSGIAIMGIGMAAFFPVMMGYTVSHFPKNAGTALSLVMAMGLVGNLLINYITGLILDYFGVDKFIYVIAALLLGLFTLLYLIRTRLLKKK
ncbi:MFS transporter [Marinilabilia salmonicolor]|uniref:MFS transporter n=1 Tax=Marinilabilia salmonicolor TaxID=989 RepID=UPI00029A947C|nr:MFS transporter [Marinilabilia salmonicolor]